jgi:hypothetical protein
VIRILVMDERVLGEQRSESNSVMGVRGFKIS